MWQVIQKHPTRQDSLNSIEKHKTTLEKLVATKNDLKGKLDLRKKQFHLLVQCVHQLQDMLIQEGRQAEDDGEASEKNGAGSVAMDTS